MTDFVTVEGRTLKQALKPVVAVIERRNTIPILGHVRLSLDKTGLRITGTDLDIEATANLDVIDGAGEWSTCLPANVLASIAAASGSMNVRIEPREYDATVSIDDVATYDVHGLPAGDFPEFGYKRDKLIEAFTNGMLAATLSKVAWCISTEETRYYLNGVAWQSRPDGCRFVATDGHRMALCRYSAAEDEPSSRIIPRKTVGIIARYLAGKDVKIFATDKDTVIDIVSPDVTFRTKLIDGTFPDVDRVIPRDDALKYDFVFRRDEIISAITQATAIGGDAGRAIRFMPDQGRVMIERQSPDFGRSAVKTSAAWPAGILDPFGFNARYFKEMAGSCQGDLTLRMMDGGAPFSITDEDETMLRVLMPMRV